MRTVALLLCVVGATACGASHPSPATPSDVPLAPQTSAGAANAQKSDDPSRALTHDECVELGEYIAQTCQQNPTRQARIDGWCSDVVSGNVAGTWAAGCEQRLKYMDYVCFRSSSSPSALMDCDRSAE